MTLSEFKSCLDRNVKAAGRMIGGLAVEDRAEAGKLFNEAKRTQRKSIIEKPTECRPWKWSTGHAHVGGDGMLMRDGELTIRCRQKTFVVTGDNLKVREL